MSTMRRIGIWHRRSPPASSTTRTVESRCRDRLRFGCRQPIWPSPSRPSDIWSIKSSVTIANSGVFPRLMGIHTSILGTRLECRQCPRRDWQCPILIINSRSREMPQFDDCRLSIGCANLLDPLGQRKLRRLRRPTWAEERAGIDNVRLKYDTNAVKMMAVKIAASSIGHDSGWDRCCFRACPPPH